jgi:hypothetical protein
MQDEMYRKSLLLGHRSNGNWEFDRGIWLRYLTYLLVVSTVEVSA